MKQDSHRMVELFVKAIEARGTGRIELGMQLFDEFIEQSRLIGANSPQYGLIREMLFPRDLSSGLAIWESMELAAKEVLHTCNDKGNALDRLDILINLAKIGFYLQDKGKIHKYLNLASELLDKLESEEITVDFPEGWASKSIIFQVRRAEIGRLYQEATKPLDLYSEITKLW